MDCNKAPQFQQHDHQSTNARNKLDTVARLQADCPLDAGAEKQQR